MLSCAARRKGQACGVETGGALFCPKHQCTFINKACRVDKDALKDLWRLYYRVWRERDRDADASREAKIILEAIKNTRRRISRFVDKLSVRAEEVECIICYETAEYPMLMMCCQNFVCCKCISQWTRENLTCPMCRTQMTPVN